MSLSFKYEMECKTYSALYIQLSDKKSYMISSYNTTRIYAWVAYWNIASEQGRQGGRDDDKFFIALAMPK